MIVLGSLVQGLSSKNGGTWRQVVFFFKVRALLQPNVLAKHFVFEWVHNRPIGLGLELPVYTVFVLMGHA